MRSQSSALCWLCISLHVDEWLRLIVVIVLWGFRSDYFLGHRCQYLLTAACFVQLSLLTLLYFYYVREQLDIRVAGVGTNA